MHDNHIELRRQVFNSSALLLYLSIAMVTALPCFLLQIQELLAHVFIEF